MYDAGKWPRASVTDGIRTENAGEPMKDRAPSNRRGVPVGLARGAWLGALLIVGCAGSGTGGSSTGGSGGSLGATGGSASGGTARRAAPPEARAAAAVTATAGRLGYRRPRHGRQSCGNAGSIGSGPAGQRQAAVSRGSSGKGGAVGSGGSSGGNAGGAGGHAGSGGASQGGTGGGASGASRCGARPGNGLLRRLRGRRAWRAARALDDDGGTASQVTVDGTSPAQQRQQVDPRPAEQQRLRHLPGVARPGGLCRSRAASSISASSFASPSR